MFTQLHAYSSKHNQAWQATHIACSIAFLSAASSEPSSTSPSTAHAKPMYSKHVLHKGTRSIMMPFAVSIQQLHKSWMITCQAWTRSDFKPEFARRPVIAKKMQSIALYADQKGV